jgi:hypothetical protein
VPGRNAFIAEVAVDLEHLVGQPGDQRALEVEFRRDAQVHVELECVVVRLEGLRRCAAIDGMQHRRLDLHEALVLHEAADTRDDLRALLETQLRILVGQDIKMALAVAQLDVGETVPFFGHRQQRLGQHGDLVGVDREFAALGAPDLTGHADDVTEIDQRQQVSRRFGCRVLVAEDLNLARGVMDIHEHAGIARRIDAACNGDDVTGHGVGFDIRVLLRQLLHWSWCGGNAPDRPRQRSRAAWRVSGRAPR